MAETVRNLFGKARALLNVYTEEGVQIPEADYSDLMAKAIPFADIANKDLFEIAKEDLTQEEPTTLTSIDDTTEVNYKADQAIVYYIAARLAVFKKKELVQFFEDEWTRLRNKCANKTTYESITDEYPISSETSESEI